MDFQARFKGKISHMTKDGVKGLQTTQTSDFQDIIDVNTNKLKNDQYQNKVNSNLNENISKQSQNQNKQCKYSQEQDNNENYHQKQLPPKMPKEQDPFLQLQPYKKDKQDKQSPRNRSFNQNSKCITQNTQQKKENSRQKDRRRSTAGLKTENNTKFKNVNTSNNSVSNYQPYSYSEFQNLQQQMNTKVKSLGPNINEELFEKQKKIKQINDFSNLVKIQNQQKISVQKTNDQKPKQTTKRELMKQFANNIPKPQPKRQNQEKQIISIQQDEVDLEKYERRHQQFLENLNQINY